MDNYFILLGLSFDPIEENEDIISEAINKKRQQWQADMKNPRKQAQAKQLIASIPDIEKVMLDPEQRKKEALKAVESIEKHISDLKNEILLLSMKGFLTNDEYDALIKKYTELGIPEESIIRNVPVPVGEGEAPTEREEVDSISDEDASQLEIYFSNLNQDDMSIYSHYDLEEFCEGEIVIDHAQKMLSNILQKGTKELSDDMEQKIAGLIINIFEKDKVAYDNYLSGFRFHKLNSLIETAVGANELLTARILSTLVKIAAKEYDFMTDGELAQYIVNHCIIKRYDVSPEALDELRFLQNEEIVEEQMEEIKPVVFVDVVKEQQEEVKQEPQEDEVVKVLNQMVTPFHSIIVNYKNKISQMASLVKQYQERRLVSGSAMSTAVCCLLFALFALNIVAAIALFSTRGYAMYRMQIILLFISIANLAAGVAGYVTIIPPFIKWRDMCKTERIIVQNEQRITEIYNDFANLSFRLLVLDIDKINTELNKIQTSAEFTFENTKKEYAHYSNISKKYSQKDYTSKVIIASIGLIILAFVAFLFFFRR